MKKTDEDFGFSGLEIVEIPQIVRGKKNELNQYSRRPIVGRDEKKKNVSLHDKYFRA